MKGLFLAGRIVFGGFFIYNGIHHLVEWRNMSQYAGAKNVPQPEAAVIASGALITLGGSLIALGVKPQLGAAAVIAFLASVSPVMHNFWAEEDPNQKMQDMIHFSKNMALLGSALALLGVEEPWPLSVPVDRPGRLERVVDIARRKIAA
jgi:putative oxidoreductase